MKDVTSGGELNAQGNDYNLEKEKYTASLMLKPQFCPQRL